MRLLGVDLVRVLAAFGVVVMHSNFGQRAPMTPAASAFSDFFTFAVPFFLAASLYFNAGNPSADPRLLGKRLARLLIPYLIWSAIYLAAHGAKLYALKQHDQLPGLLRSIPAHLLLGSAAVHLYFLPLLAVATVTMFLLNPWLRRTPVWGIGVFLLMGFLIAATVGSSPPPVESSETWKVGVTFLHWFARTLPIVIAAVVVERCLPRERLSRLPAFCLPMAVILVFAPSLLPFQFIPPGAYDVWMGFGWFFVGCTVGRWLSASAWLDAVSAATFGIFLVHHLLVEGIHTCLERGWPASATATTFPLLLAISITAFFLSFLSVHFIPRWLPITRRLFMVGSQ